MPAEDQLAAEDALAAEDELDMDLMRRMLAKEAPLMRLSNAPSNLI